METVSGGKPPFLTLSCTRLILSSRMKGFQRSTETGEFESLAGLEGWLAPAISKQCPYL